MEAGAADWHDFVRWRRAGTGLARAGEPVADSGTVGAAPIQNIGAYGLEMADARRWMRWSWRPGRRTSYRGELRFGYRDSVLRAQSQDAGW